MREREVDPTDLEDEAAERAMDEVARRRGIPPLVQFLPLPKLWEWWRRLSEQKEPHTSEPWVRAAFERLRVAADEGALKELEKQRDSLLRKVR